MPYQKTPKGQEAIQQRNVPMSARQRTLLLLADGRRHETELLNATAGLGCTAADVQTLVTLGCLEAVAEQGSIRPSTRAASPRETASLAATNGALDGSPSFDAWPSQHLAQTEPRRAQRFFSGG